MNELKQEVRELLNQVVIKLTNLPASKINASEWDEQYDGKSGGWVTTTKEQQDNLFLNCVKEFCERSLENETYPAVKSDDYYNSGC